jgi:hypothetical protein
MSVIHNLPNASFQKPKPIKKNRHERRIQLDRRAQEHRELDRMSTSDRREGSENGSHNRRSMTAGDSFMPTPAAPFINQALLLNFLGQQPIVFQRIYVDVAGSVIAALWLSNAINKMTEMAAVTDSEGRFKFSLSAAQCEEETGISRHQQVTCRRLLINQGLLSEEGFRTHITVFHLHLDVLAEKMMANSMGLAKILQESANGLSAITPRPSNNATSHRSA